MVNREILLAVAGMAGIEDTALVTPKWMHPKTTGKDGIHKAGAQAIMLAVKLRVLKQGALNSLGTSLPEIQKLAEAA